MKWSAALGAVVVVVGSIAVGACANGDSTVDTGGDPGNGADTSTGNPSSDGGGNPYGYDATTHGGGGDATMPNPGNDATMPSSGDSAPPGFQTDSAPPPSGDSSVAAGVCDPNNPKYIIELLSGSPPPCDASGMCPAGQCCFSGIACLAQ